MEEIWKPIEGYEDYYEVSNYGRVRSLDRVIKKSNGVLQPRMGKIMPLKQIRSSTDSILKKHK